MTIAPIGTLSQNWKTYDKILFRFFFLYFILFLLPFDWGFWKHLVLFWQEPLGYIVLFNLANYAPHFFANTATYADWGSISLAAIAGTAIWTKLDNGRSGNYTILYYWLRVMLRYRLSATLLTYGFLLLFALWAPYPSISQLNTSYGDFTLWKLFVVSLGVSPFYQFFLGIVEITIGLLLLYRKTVPIAALIALIFLGNVYVSNIAYEGNMAVYSLFLITGALFLLLYDIRQFIDLLILQQPTAPRTFKSIILSRKQQLGKEILRVGFVTLFMVVYGFSIASAYYQQKRYRLTSTNGLIGLEGLYNVTEFRLNNNVIPYSNTDTLRWQDVVFEKWNTLSIRTYASMNPYPDAPEGLTFFETNISYESAGSSGRRYYSYTVDTLRSSITLYNQYSYNTDTSLKLHYHYLPNKKLLLTGTIDNKDSITIILERISKIYLLEEAVKTGRRVTLIL